MEDLSKKKCVPCEGGIPSFNLSEIHKYLKKVDGWDVKKNDNENFYLLKPSGFNFFQFQPSLHISSRLLFGFSLNFESNNELSATI